MFYHKAKLQHHGPYQTRLQTPRVSRIRRGCAPARSGTIRRPSIQTLGVPGTGNQRNVYHARRGVTSLVKYASILNAIALWSIHVPVHIRRSCSICLQLAIWSNERSDSGVECAVRPRNSVPPLVCTTRGSFTSQLEFGCLADCRYRSPLLSWERSLALRCLCLGIPRVDSRRLIPDSSTTPPLPDSAGGRIFPSGAGQWPSPVSCATPTWAMCAHW